MNVHFVIGKSFWLFYCPPNLPFLFFMLLIALVLLHGREILLHLTLLPLSNVQCQCTRLTWVICSFCVNISQNARTWFQPHFSLFYSTAKKQPSLLLWCVNKMKKFKTHHPMHKSNLFLWITKKLILSQAHTYIHSLHGIFIFPELELFLALLDVFPSHS